MTYKIACPLASALACFLLAGAAAQAEERMLAHDVYFSLKDKSPEGKEKLVAACKKYLAGHPGTVWFSAGPLAGEFQRDVNDRDFDVALHVVFKDKAAHDAYQTAERHLKFIEESQDLWEKVRVFDSYVWASDHGPLPAKAEGGEQAKKVTLPDPAAAFAGMIQGEVVKKGHGEMLLKVEKIAQVWQHSKAKDPNALVGKRIAVGARVEEGKVAPLQIRFIESLKVGEKITVDVAHQKGETLTILELTDDQRQRGKE
jgi:hypothetical protein